jgi:hypothetical protein
MSYSPDSTLRMYLVWHAQHVGLDHICVMQCLGTALARMDRNYAVINFDQLSVSNLGSVPLRNRMSIGFVAILAFKGFERQRDFGADGVLERCCIGWEPML